MCWPPTYEQVADVIVTMVVRGAPAIGVSAAYGVALGALQSTAKTAASSRRVFERSVSAWPAHGPQQSISSGPSTA